MNDTHPGESPLEPLAPGSDGAEAVEAVQQTAEAIDARKRKVVANEAIYRELNEELENLAPYDKALLVCCECGDINCSLPFEISRATWDAARSDPLLFVLVPGHEDPSVEEVVERAETFEIVRKYPSAAIEIAEMSDRRLERDEDS